MDFFRDYVGGYSCLFKCMGGGGNRSVEGSGEFVAPELTLDYMIRRMLSSSGMTVRERGIPSMYGEVLGPRTGG